MGEEPPSQLGVRHRARTGRDLELVQVGGHCGHHERCLRGELGPCHLGPPAAKARRGVVRLDRSLGHPQQSLGLDGFDGSAILVGQPVYVQVQTDPRRVDRAVSGLGLDGLDGHPRFPQADEAGVAQLVVGAVAETGPLAGGADDLVQTRCRERLAARGPLSETETESLVVSAGRSWFM
jgi:hypothetical protein